MPSYDDDDRRQPASSSRASLGRSIDISIRIPRPRTADGGRIRSFSWRNWFAHGA
jgi:hypothetical protein